jgi:hypothetical protein
VGPTSAAATYEQAPVTQTDAGDQAASNTRENAMGLLKCKLFTTPKEDAKLEACRVSDPAHIQRGAVGDHVKKIQSALNQLSKGRENFNLKVDGIYGPKTAAAVLAYKNSPSPSRRILQPFQTTADDIVGKRTIESLDNEMDFLENEIAVDSILVSTTELGSGPPHDHIKCPSFGSNGRDGHVQHRATPINPQGGRRINIGGEFETQYLGFEDFVTDGPPVNKKEIFSGKLIRPFTHSLRSHSVSNICMRSTPITFERDDGGRGNGQGEREISRIAMPGCRLTVASPPSFLLLTANFLMSLGTLVEDITVFDTEDKDDEDGLRAFVIIMRGDDRFSGQ